MGNSPYVFSDGDPLSYTLGQGSGWTMTTRGGLEQTTMAHSVNRRHHTEINHEGMPPLNDRGTISPTLKLNGLVRITGAGHDLLVELRDARVARFRRAETETWSENGPGGRLTSPVVTYEKDRLHFAWAFCEAAVKGSNGIRQEFSFDGMLQSDGTIQGFLSLRMIARFLEPQVVLKDVRGPALVVPELDHDATHAA